MAFSMTVSEKVTVSGRSITSDTVLSGTGQVSVDESIADETTDGAISSFAVDQSEIVGLFILSDQALTLETNDGTTPDDTIALSAGVPVVWHEDSIHSCPITADITALYVTNASGAAAHLQIEILVDATA